MTLMEVHDLSDRGRHGIVDAGLHGQVAAVHSRLARPFWGGMGLWAAGCGALASNALHWVGQDLLTLVLVLVLVDLAWGSVWVLVDGIDWRRLLVAGVPKVSVKWGPTLPYLQPDSPAESLFRRLGRFSAWWRQVLWPSSGPSLLGLVSAGVLAGVLTLLLPRQIAPLNAVLVGIVGLGVAQRWRGGLPLVAQSFAMVGLSWLAGHAAFAAPAGHSIMLAVCYSLATWGGQRLAAGQSGALWLLNGGQAAAIVVLVVLRQPLAAGLVGLLLFGQIALHPSLCRQAAPAQVVRRTWPWLFVSMLGAALAIP